MPPKFGHHMLEQFCLDQEFTNLNHGAFGVMPKAVLEEYFSILRYVESNPDLFIRLEFQDRVLRVRDRLAKLIGAHKDDCVFVPSVANGVNTVLRNFEWKQGDIIVMMNTTYTTVSRAIHHLASLPNSPIIEEFLLRLPISHSSILKQFESYIQSLRRSAIAEGYEDPNIVVILDSIVCTPAILLPWKEMVEICKKEKVWSLVDAAHSLGQEVGLELDEIQPDFWVASCHKWLYTKRGCAVLYVPKRNQHIMKTPLPTGLHWVSPTPDYDPPEFVSNFMWFGWTDGSTPLSINAAIDYRESLGGEAVINEYCRNLAIRGGKRLAELMGTNILDSDDKEGELILNMVNVELPINQMVPLSKEAFRMFQEKLLKEHKVFGTIFHYENKWWIRASAQIYNELEDFDKLAKALIIVCREVEARCYNPA